VYRFSLVGTPEETLTIIGRVCEWAIFRSGLLNAPCARIGECRVQANHESRGEVEMAAYVGIDIHKKYCHAALMDEAGRIQHELRFDNTLQGASGLVNLARSIDPQVKAVVEPSANYWIKMALVRVRWFTDAF